jgi:hypothetical protein
MSVQNSRFPDLSKVFQFSGRKYLLSIISNISLNFAYDNKNGKCVVFSILISQKKGVFDKMMFVIVVPYGIHNFIEQQIYFTKVES